LTPRSRPAGATSASACSASTAPRSSRSRVATSTAPNRSSSASTPNASPGTCSARCAATAATSCAPPSMIGSAERGVLLYLDREGRGIGLFNKVRAYGLQDGGLDTVDANVELGLPVDARDYSAAASVLHELGVQSVRLI